MILDWVPAHFPSDEHGLVVLRRHAPVRARRSAPGLPPRVEELDLQLRPPRGASFLLSSALLLARPLPRRRAARRRRGVDALPRLLAQGRRVDPQRRTAASENLEAIELLRELNEAVRASTPDVQTIAEESTAWPHGHRPAHVGGLGFGFKWDMGWMHDTLAYFARDPVHRSHHHDELTFRGLYALHENFVLPLSHDEVVHGKRSLLEQDARRRVAAPRQPAAAVRVHVRAAGQEAAVHGRRARPAARVEPRRQPRLAPARRRRRTAGAPAARATSTALYRERAGAPRARLRARRLRVDRRRRRRAQRARASSGAARERSRAHGVRCSTSRRCRGRTTASGSTVEGCWREVLNTDAIEYGGSGQGNLGGVEATLVPAHGRPFSIVVTAPPLGACFFRSP